MPTFAELGIPFPLFEADIQDACDSYQGEGHCAVCAEERPHTFSLGGGDYLMQNCPQCDALNGLPASAGESATCRSCRFAFPPLTDAGKLSACYDCLRGGAVALTQDTELGMVSWEQAMDGVTNGVPGLSRDDFEMVLLEEFEGEEWYGARLPKEDMWELLRTPSYSTWQGECWLFCCRKPMTYIGEWKREDFARHAPDGDGRALFLKMLPDESPYIWDGLGEGPHIVYVFRCRVCGGLSANSDYD
jgi:phage FluMu protein Com